MHGAALVDILAADHGADFDVADFLAIDREALQRAAHAAGRVVGEGKVALALGGSVAFTCTLRPAPFLRDDFHLSAVIPAAWLVLSAGEFLEAAVEEFWVERVGLDFAACLGG